MTHEPTPSFEQEPLDVAEDKIAEAISGTLEDYVRTERISEASRQQLLDLARDNFYMALEQGSPYGVALEFALDTCKGFEADDRNTVDETAFFWQLALHEEGEMPTGDEIDRSMVKFDKNLAEAPRILPVELGKTADKAIDITQIAGDGVEIPIDVTHDAKPDSSAADESDAHAQAERAAAEIAASVEAEQAAESAADAAEAQAIAAAEATKPVEPTEDEELIESINKLTDSINADKHETARERKPRLPDALRRPSSRHLIPDMDAEELHYYGKIRSHKVANQPIITVGYDARNAEQFDAGITDEHEADERGTMLLKASDHSEFYLDRGHLLTRHRDDDGSYRDNGIALRVTAIRAAIGKPLEYTYLGDDGEPHQVTTDATITSGIRVIPAVEGHHYHAVNTHESTINRWLRIAKRMDAAIDRRHAGGRADAATRELADMLSR